MSYIKTKLSIQDKDILNIIYQELEKITLPTTFQQTGGQGHQIRTGTVNQKFARQTCFGKVHFQGQIKDSVYTKKYPYMMSLFKLFIKNHYPSFKFKSVYVNKNTICKEHVDSKNIGESLLVGFGNYTGGQTILFINNKPVKIHIKTYSLIFNGTQIIHKSEEFKGTRYSLVFFN